jgi:hypothetical protein
MGTAMSYFYKPINKEHINETPTETPVNETPTTKSTFFVGDYEITNLCLKTYPCQHSVRKNKNRWELLSGENIYIRLKTNGLKHEHFDKYEEFIRKRDDPVEQEKRRILNLMLEKQREKMGLMSKKELVKKYKASSRLERLHKKNNAFGNNKVVDSAGIDNNRYKRSFIGHYEFGACLESMPCQYEMRKISVKPKKFENYFGETIYKMLKNDGFSDEMFDRYGDPDYCKSQYINHLDY